MISHYTVSCYPQKPSCAETRFSLLVHISLYQSKYMEKSLIISVLTIEENNYYDNQVLIKTSNHFYSLFFRVKLTNIQVPMQIFIIFSSTPSNLFLLTQPCRNWIELVETCSINSSAPSLTLNRCLGIIHKRHCLHFQDLSLHILDSDINCSTIVSSTRPLPPLKMRRHLWMLPK